MTWLTLKLNGWKVNTRGKIMIKLNIEKHPWGNDHVIDFKSAKVIDKDKYQDH